MVDASGPCWIWQGKSKLGYGFVKRGGKEYRAHRWLWEQVVGPIPDGLVIDHLCRNTLCVNPDHLEPVTNRENVVRGIRPAQLAVRFADRTHCKRGHEWVQGDALCKQCRRERGRVYDARRRGAERLSGGAA
ncbi:MAG: HNH endonuclease signature motif containing protein [Microbacteriaceae bacterium]